MFKGRSLSPRAKPFSPSHLEHCGGGTQADVGTQTRTQLVGPAHVRPACIMSGCEGYGVYEVCKAPPVRPLARPVLPPTWLAACHPPPRSFALLHRTLRASRAKHSLLHELHRAIQRLPRPLHLTLPPLVLLPPPATLRLQLHPLCRAAPCRSDAQSSSCTRGRRPTCRTSSCAAGPSPGATTPLPPPGCRRRWLSCTTPRAMTAASPPPLPPLLLLLLCASAASVPTYAPPRTLTPLRLLPLRRSLLPTLDKSRPSDSDSMRERDGRTHLCAWPFPREERCLGWLGVSTRPAGYPTFSRSLLATPDGVF